MWTNNAVRPEPSTLFGSINKYFDLIRKYSLRKYDPNVPKRGIVLLYREKHNGS